METLSIFKQLTAELSEGPSPSFNEAQILKTFELLGQNEIGRKQLPERLSLGEGVVRTIIKRFKINGLAVTSRSGTRLTDKGMNVLSDINTYVRSAIIPKTQMTVRSCNYAVLVREKSESIRSGMEQRDHALIAGASGATTIVYKNAGLQMPGYTLEIEPDI